MQLQRFDPKMVSITQVRRDIDILEDTLGKHDEALVVRNQDLLFVAISPKRYEEYQNMSKQNDTDTIIAAVANINAIRQKYGQGHGKNAGSKYVIKMRDEAKKRWTK